MFQQLPLLGRYWMLDTGCWIFDNLPRVNFKNIEHPACRAVALKERRLETSIQDQLMPPMVFVETKNCRTFPDCIQAQTQ